MARKKRDHDFAVNAFRVVREATKESQSEQPQSQDKIEGKNPHAVALGKLGGKKGGKARASKMTPEQHEEMARSAARARWSKAKKL